jgi:hypothetical protein
MLLMSARDPRWMTLFGLTNDPAHRPRFSLRHALLSGLVMVLVALAVKLTLEASTSVGDTWATVISVAAGYIVSILTIGGAFVRRDQ